MKPKLDTSGNIIKDEGGLIQWEYEPYKETAKWQKHLAVILGYLKQITYFVVMGVFLLIIFLATIGSFQQYIEEWFY